MSTTASTPHNPTHSPREQYLDVYQQEHERTMRVLRAYPRDKSELQPHPKLKTARELAWQFVVEQGLVEKALTTGFDFSKPKSASPAVPESFDEVLAACEAAHKKVAGLIGQLRDDEMYDTVQFYTGPGKIGEMTRAQFLWYVLHDQIHHRGQFSVYLRMADGKVPAIYGPSADEPWM
jgi:uncharacterized damage-inducible protein DinB